MKQNPIFLALDVDDPKQANQLVEQTSGWVGGFKVGPRLLFAAGVDWVKQLSKKHSVFLDLKFYDIPNTMSSSVEAAFNMGVEYVTIHGLAGPESLRVVSELEKTLSQQRAFKVLAVTILTSYQQETLPQSLAKTPISNLVNGLVQEVSDSGLSGVVCSGEEVAALRAQFSDMFLVTPGVRPVLGVNSDQKRVVTPSQALKNGSDMLVIGRPIYQAQDPAASAKAIYESIYEK